MSSFVADKIVMDGLTYDDVLLIPAYSEVLPKQVELKMKEMDAVLDFHVRFERIHPFQDGNGRVGRLLMFWQCLQHGVTPFIVTEDLRLYYYRGLQSWGQVNGFLRDTILTAQDMFEDVMQYFGIRR